MTNKTLTPRQRMINMMYLVLIAMLALNVSREILKSFHLFELSFINGNKTTEARNEEMMLSFAEKMKSEKTKVKTEKWYALAIEARSVSKEFYEYVEKMKADIIKKGGGREEAEKGSSTMPELKRPDDMEAHAHYFIDDGLGNGKKLQQKINETREKLASLVLDARHGQTIRASLINSSQLKANDPAGTSGSAKTWVSMYLENAPLAGVVTMLTKTQNDCKSLEADVLTVLNENINIESISHDGQIAMIIPESKNVMSGESFNARVALMSYDTRSASQMLVNGQPITVNNGFGYISIPASGTGAHSLQASIESINPKTGEPTFVKSDVMTWNSFQASASISADNMNVLFIGLENPMSISVPGITPENTVVTASGGISLQNHGGGKFTARVSGAKNSGKIYVSARTQEGGVKSMGEMEYKIRKVPTPKLRLGNLAPGSYEKSTIMSQPFLYAFLEDFYFKGVQYKVTKYKVTLVTRRITNTPEIVVHGNTTAAAKGVMGQAKPGDMLYFDDITATGPGGSVRLESMSLKIR
jgi:gliding motility-associated protein GldM